MKAKLLFAALLGAVMSLTASAMEIDLKLHNVTVKEAIAALNKIENWSIVINSDEIDLSRKVSVDATGASIGTVLDQIFAGQGVSYVISGSSVSITRQAPGGAEVPHLLPRGGLSRGKLLIFRGNRFREPR